MGWICNCDAPVEREQVDENFWKFECTRCGESRKMFIEKKETRS